MEFVGKPVRILLRVHSLSYTQVAGCQLVEGIVQSIQQPMLQLIHVTSYRSPAPLSTVPKVTQRWTDGSRTYPTAQLTS